MLKRKRPIQHYKCPAGCKDKMFKSQKDLNEHVKTKHPNYRFKCHYCTHVFKTYNARFKHELGHGELPYQCSICLKTFLYKKHMGEHKKVHTKKNLYICPSRGCGKSYTTKGALKAHMVIHEGKTFLCPEYGKSFNTKPNLDQHRQGKHLGGWVATCGKMYEWPAPYASS